MADKYICQLRRGWKDDTTGRDDWGYYEVQDEHVKPRPGELVVEYDNGIPRLKIGDGTHEFSELPYISVDSFILPTKASVTIYPDKWLPVLDDDGNVVEGRYFQLVDVEGATITPNSKVDLQPKPEMLLIFQEKDLSFTAINSGGNVRVCVVGQKPTAQYTIQVTVTEVVIDA